MMVPSSSVGAALSASCLTIGAGYTLHKEGLSQTLCLSTVFIDSFERVRTSMRLWLPWELDGWVRCAVAKPSRVWPFASDSSVVAVFSYCGLQAAPLRMKTLCVWEGKLLTQRVGGVLWVEGGLHRPSHLCRSVTFHPPLSPLPQTCRGVSKVHVPGVAVQDQALEWLHRRLTADARRAESYMFFLGGYTLVAFF